MPSDKTSQTSLWNPPTAQRKVKGGNGRCSFNLPVALPRRNSQLRRCPALPHPPSLCALSGVFWPLAKTGAILRTGFQVSPLDFQVKSR